MRQRTATLNRRRQLEPLLKQQNQQINMFERRAIDRKLQNADCGRRGAGPQVGDPHLHPGDRGHHRRRSAGRDARAGRPQRQGRRQSGRVGRRSARVGGLAGPGLHPGRTGAGATAPVHAGVSALRWNPDLAEVYRRLSERGKPGKVALVAVMRKLTSWPTPSFWHLVARSAPSDLLRPRRDPVRKGRVDPLMAVCRTSGQVWPEACLRP